MPNTLEPTAIIIFGASGDLTKRKLLPALYQLVLDGHAPERFNIIGVARTVMSRAEYQAIAREALERAYKQPLEEGAWQHFAEMLDYKPLDFNNVQDFIALRVELEAAGFLNWLFYCSVPPSAFPIITQQLGESGLSSESRGYTRIIVEKPFGTNLETAKTLNLELHKVFTESQIYRIDHFHCVLRTRFLNRFGIVITWIIFKLLLPRIWVWKDAVGFTKKLAFCVTWCKII
jgi:glucose-6-phosphate 1-dehydrogenase